MASDEMSPEQVERILGKSVVLRSEIAKAREEAYAAGQRAGAEAMREQAARYMLNRWAATIGSEEARAILSLPLPDEVLTPAKDGE